MSRIDTSFLPEKGFEYAINLLCEVPLEVDDLPEVFPDRGIGEIKTLWKIRGTPFSFKVLLNKMM